jgi:hypothetical protein
VRNLWHRQIIFGIMLRRINIKFPIAINAIINRGLHLNKASVIQTKIDQNSTEYQVKFEFVYFEFYKT